MAVVRHKEAIHSGHFMVSEFEAEAQDEDDIAVVPPPEEGSNLPELLAVDDVQEINEPQLQSLQPVRATKLKEPSSLMVAMRKLRESRRAQSIIDISLNKLFQSMSIAYRQKLTSPKWNRFRGLKLRWKDKIRLNNVIWRCWHMQFVKGQRRLLCAFANPLDIDYHNKTEGSTVLEGKYWKRKLDAIKCEYQKWRRFYCEPKSGGMIGHEDDEDQKRNGDSEWDALFLRSPFQFMEGSKDDVELESMLTDEGLMLDIIFNASNTNGNGSTGLAMPDPFFTGASYLTGNGNGLLTSSMTSGGSVSFDDPKDMYYKNTLNADFIQPGLGSLQPNLDDFSFECNIIGDIFDQQRSVQTLQAMQGPILIKHFCHTIGRGVNYVKTLIHNM